MRLNSASLASPLRRDEGGVLRVGASRVMVERVVYAFDAGASAEEIVASYPTLDLGDVYATITVILKNRAEVDAYMTENAGEAERSHRRWEAKYPTADLQRRIQERAIRS